MGMVAALALGKAKSGRVLTVFCDDVDLARRQFRAATEEQGPVPTLVTLEWERAPSLARELDEIRDALANAAASLWPNWYITAEQRFEESRQPDLELSALVTEAACSSPGASPSWLREVWRRCRAGKPPVVDSMASAEQVRQLSRALDPTRLVLSLSVESDDASSARVRGLARAAEWLARESQAKVMLLVPISWHGHPELDHVSYGAIVLHKDEVAPRKSERPASAGGSHSSNGSASLATCDNPPPHVLVGPIVGKPHPGSEVEQLLFERIGSDHQLRGLFEYNQRLTAYGKRQYIVDLVWRSGGLVVELDGPEHHGHLTYVNDRDRDYRLLLSGYTTLRVANDEVYVDPEAVLQKIRNMVCFLKARNSEREFRHEL